MRWCWPEACGDLWRRGLQTLPAGSVRGVDQFTRDFCKIVLGLVELPVEAEELSLGLLKSVIGLLDLGRKRGDVAMFIMQLTPELLQLA